MFRFRFRLITLFAVMSIVAVGAAVYGMHRRALIAEHQALLKIAGKGGWVVKSANGSVTVEFFAQQPAKPPMLWCGTGVERTYRPTGDGVDFSDADLVLFDDVLMVSHIKFQGTSISSAAQEDFKRQHPRCHFEDY